MLIDFVIGHGVNQIPRILTAPWDLYHTFYQNQLSQILTCHCEVSDFGFCSFALRTWNAPRNVITFSLSAFVVLLAGVSSMDNITAKI